jgi:hypothetical protein
MKRFFLAAGAWVFALAMVAPLCAEGEHSNDAEAIKVVGQVRFSRDMKKYHPLLEGQWVTEGDTLSTQEGQAVLRFEDGTVLGLRPKTQLTLQRVQVSPQKSERIFKLAKGFVRSIVSKLGMGSRYEVHTPNSIAAVKGTDFQQGYENGETQTRTYHSEGEGVELTDAHGHKGMVGPGEEGRMNQGGYMERPMTHEEQENDKRSYDAALESHAPQGSGGQNQQRGQGQGGGQQPQGQGKGAEQGGEGNSNDDLNGAIEGALDDLTDDLNQGSGDTVREILGDSFSGVALIDRYGYRVQVSRYVQRPTSNSVSKISYTLRTEGGQAGTSTFAEKLVFNQALPEDWTMVANRGLNDTANLSGGRPSFWRTQEAVSASNPRGANLCLIKDLNAPEKVGSKYYQGGTNYYNVNHASVGYTDFTATGAQSGGDVIGVHAQHWGDGWKLTWWNETLGSEMFTVKAWLLNAEGQTLSWAGVLDSPKALRDFSLVDTQGFVELAITAPGFGNDMVDVVMPPKFMQGGF